MSLLVPTPCDSLSCKARELAAYEFLWSQNSSSFRILADFFRATPGYPPSHFVGSDIIDSFLPSIESELLALYEGYFDVKVNHLTDYPSRLRDASNPIELLYYKGDWNLLNYSKIVSIVGSRKPSFDGMRRARKLVNLLVNDGYIIMSGLAEGIDTIAHTSALEFGGRTIAVIGTPINQCYPKKNKHLQDEVSKHHLLISQVPFERYKKQDYRLNRFFFPERNATMSALSQATIIIEAGETSGTLTQAKAAIAQGRKLFILENNFLNTRITWPTKFNNKGAVRLKTYEDFLDNMV